MGLFELFKDNHMSILYHLGKANIVVDGLKRLSMGSTTYFVDDKKVLVKDIHILVRLGIQLMNSTEGGVVLMNRV